MHFTSASPVVREAGLILQMDLPAACFSMAYPNRGHTRIVPSFDEVNRKPVAVSKHKLRTCFSWPFKVLRRASVGMVLDRKNISNGDGSANANELDLWSIRN